MFTNLDVNGEVSIFVFMGTCGILGISLVS